VSFCVVLRRVAYPGRWVKRDTLLARGVTKSAAERLADEYRATGWRVDVLKGEPPAGILVPAPTRRTWKDV